jgi:hypothetical protein
MVDRGWLGLGDAGMSTEARIYEILKGVPGVKVRKVQRLWQIRVGKRGGAREDGESLARDMLGDWHALNAAVNDPRDAIVAEIETLVEAGPAIEPEIEPLAEPEPVPVHMAEPEPVEIPAFLAEPPDQSEPPEAVRELIRENEPHGEAQDRLLALYRMLGNKLMLGLASEDEGRLHSRLHGSLHWIDRGAVEVTGKD